MFDFLPIVLLKGLQIRHFLKTCPLNKVYKPWNQQVFLRTFSVGGDEKKIGEHPQKGSVTKYRYRPDIGQQNSAVYIGHGHLQCPM